MEEERRRKMMKLSDAQSTSPSTAPTTEHSDMYLILPNFAEIHKAEINDILAKEKIKLCSDMHFAKTFKNVNFKIAFENSSNIKKLVTRTKI